MATIFGSAYFGISGCSVTSSTTTATSTTALGANVALIPAAFGTPPTGQSSTTMISLALHQGVVGTTPVLPFFPTGSVYINMGINTACGTAANATNATACVPTYGPVQSNVHSIGGIGVPGAPSVLLCQIECNNNSTCSGIDFDPTGNPQCYFLSASIVNTTVASTGVQHYYKVPCPGPCASTYAMTANMHIYGGSLNATANTVALCQADCDANSACVGFDYTVASNQCWPNANASAPTNKAVMTGTDNYIKQPCAATGTGCVNSYVTTNNTHMSSGVLNTAYNSVTLCQNACNTDLNCVGFDYTYASNQCWLNTNATAPQAKAPMTGTANFIKQVCGSSISGSICTNTYTPTNNTHMFGGNQDSTANTVALCQLACDTNTSCVGFDYTYATNQCWLNVNASAPSNKVALIGTANFIKVPCASACVNTYTTTNNTHMSGGVPYTAANSVSLCQAACSANASCVGFDFTYAGNVCWLNYIATSPQTKTGLAGTANFIKIACGGSSSSGSVCANTYTTTNNTHMSWGTINTASTTVALCQAACDANPQCVGFDFTYSPPACWFNTNATAPQTKTALVGTANFIKQPCGSSSSSGVCVSAWTETQNSHMQNGVLNTAYTTLSTCMATCWSLTNCYAFDWIVSVNQCWLNSNPAEPVLSLTGATNYQKSQCGSSSSSPASTNCVAVYSVKNNTHMPNGVLNSSLTTTTACMDYCTNSPSCVGFDFVSGLSPQCWINTNIGNTAQQAEMTGVISYVKGPCPGSSSSVCLAAYRMMNNTHMSNGVVDPAATSVSACESSCTNNPSCIGFDYITAQNQCWINTNAANIITQSSLTGAQNYIKIPCPGSSSSPCASTYLITSDTHMVGATQNTAYTTQTACQTFCTGSPTCLAFDFVSSVVPQQCWIHTNPDDLLSKLAATGVTNYVKTPCGSSSSACIATFTTVLNTHMLGGTPNTAYTSLDTCQQFCSGSPSCKAFDLDTVANPQGCWIHTNSADLTTAQPSPGVNNYVKQPCTGASSQPPGCPSGGLRYQETLNSHMIGAIVNNLLTTQMLCQAACDASIFCVAYDFQTANSQCFIHTNPSALGTQTFLQGVTNYRKIPCIGSTPFPTPFPTQRPVPQANCLMRVQLNEKNAGGQARQLANTMNGDQCMWECLVDPTCQVSVYEKSTRNCRIHQIALSGIPDDKFIRYVKLCS